MQMVPQSFVIHIYEIGGCSSVYRFRRGGGGVHSDASADKLYVTLGFVMYNIYVFI